MLPIVATMILALLAGACRAAPPAPLTDTAKRDRIATLYREYRESFPEVPSLDVAALQDLEQKTRVVLVDVRSPEEQAVSTIPGAIPASRLKKHLDDYRDALVVTYCTIGYRSGLYARELREKGLDARNLAGSILAWTHAGLPLVDAEGRRTRRVHVYGKRWNLAASGYQAVW
jgi:rhodanese-related sulfurtransferase